MKKLICGVSLLLAFTACAEKEKNSVVDPTDFFPELVGGLHNDGVKFVFDKIENAIETKTMTASEVSIKYVLETTDEYLVSKGYDKFFDSEYGEMFLSTDMYFDLGEWDYTKIIEESPERVKNYLERLDGLFENVVSLDDVLDRSFVVEGEIENDPLLTSEERTGLLTAYSTLRASAEYWDASAESWALLLNRPYIPATKGFGDWWSRHERTIVADCIWAQQGFFTVAASGIPLVWVIGAVGGGIAGSVIANM